MELAQLGINLIERTVLEMSCRWQPTVGIDTGIDGHIELCDHEDPPHPLGLLLHVQSRATDHDWPGESAERFTYTCLPEDVEYWLQGNAPVLLIVSRPRTNEAYWISTKDYFNDPARRRTRQIVFDKIRDRFCAETYEALFQLARPRDSGLYLAPPRASETLTTNLLPVEQFGPRLYVADTQHRTREEIFAALHAVGVDPGGVFIPTDKRLISPYDLREEPWPQVCDRGTVEDFAASEWAFSDDRDRQREYARLLRLALAEKVYPQVRVWKDKNVFAFSTFGETHDRRFQFNFAGRKRKPSVVRVYKWEWQGKEWLRFRHLAMGAAFRLSADRWFLEVTPTYLFTRDGRTIDPRHEELLSGIKRLERQPAVLRQLQLWEAFLRSPGDIFRGVYPYLVFGDLVRLPADFGIADQTWQPWDEAPTTADLSDQPELLPEELWN